MKSKLHGVLVALVTPTKATGEVDLGTLRAHTEAMVAAGIHGLIPLGSTGEFYALTEIPEGRRAQRGRS